MPQIEALLTALIECYKAGSPTDERVFWITVKPARIAALFFEQHQIYVSNGEVKRLLNKLGYRRRKQCKELATGNYALRNEQFLIIISILAAMSREVPVLSIDCKKKERLGNLYRDGKCYCTAAIEVFDHDYEHLSKGKVVPHGIYDIQANKGFISIGDSSETADFIIDNLTWWWEDYGIHAYPDANNLILLCDAGGANSYRHHIFKYKLLAFAKTTGLSVTVCHYPPYCSKWNPIEHRLFCHVHSAMSGTVFSDYNIIKTLIEQTQTKTGLTVVVRLNLNKYEIGAKIDKGLIDDKRILRHPQIPELNYKICA
jgi:hypothetical protein